MIQNPITFVVSNNGTILGGQRGTIRALSNYASKIYLVAPFESVSVKANYLIYESKREIIGHYLAPTTLTGSDVLATTDPQYQTAAQWSVWEASISQRALHRIAKYKAGRIGVSFEITNITQPSQALSFQGLFGKTQSDVLPAVEASGNYYICDSYNFTSNGILFTKGDYAYSNGTAWLKGQNIAQVAMTTTQDLSVDPSLQAEIPEDISEDAELEALIDILISDVGDLSTDLTAHIADLDDPHDTQANQVDGTYRSQASDVQDSLDTIADEIDGIVEGETDIAYDNSIDDIITADTVDGALHQLDSATHEHITDQTNPHNVVASQVNATGGITVQTALNNLEADKVEKNPDTITSVSGSNKVYVNDGAEKVITVENFKTSIVSELVAFAYKKFTEKDENGQPVVASPQTNKIYIYDDPNSEIENDIYEEWIWVEEDNAFEQIGTTQVQLSDYYTKVEADALLDDKSDVGHTHDDRYYTETETDAFVLDAKKIQYYPNTKNTSGLPIPKGTVVQFAGSQGDFLLIKAAVPSEIATNPESLMGLAENTIADNAFGNVVWFGQVSNLVVNPDIYDNGDVLYFDYNTGGLTTTAPAENKIIIAAVEKVSSQPTSTNGILLVRVKWVSRDISQVDGLQNALDGKSAVGHTHTESDITNLDKYTQSQVDTLLSGKANTSHTHVKADITDFAHTHDDRYYTETELDAGQLDNRYYTETEIDANHYTKSEVDGKLDQFVYSIYTPIAELNDKSLYEVFGDGNVIVNGDFSDGSSSWQFGNASVIDGKASLGTTVADAYIRPFQSILPYTDDGNTYFISWEQQITSGTGNKLFNTTLYNTNGIQSYKGLILATPLFDNDGTSQYTIDNVYALNLTSLGISSLTQEQLKLYLDLYIKLKPTEIAETTTHTQTESIKAVPTGTLNGTVDNFEADGLTLVNGIVNGDFSDGLNGWTTVLTTGSITVTNGVANLTTTDNSLVQLQYPFVWNNTSKYFVSLNILSITGSLSISPEGVSSENFTTSGYKGVIFENPNATIQRLNINRTFGGNVNANIDNIMLINMTALGIASYTEAQMLDLVRSGYFEGIANVDNPSVTAVGKNLFDYKIPTEIQSTYFKLLEVDNGFESSSDNSSLRWIRYRVNVVENTNYTFSYIANQLAGPYSPSINIVNDLSVSLGTASGNGNKSVSFNSGSSNYIDIYFNTRIADSFSYTKWTNLQLEYGSSATTYEPYQPRTLTLNTPLRSLPNGVRDRVYEQNGEVWLEKRVGESIIQASDLLGINDLVNLDNVQLNKPLDYKFRASSSQVFDTVIHERFTPKNWAVYDSVDNIGTIGGIGSNVFGLFVANGTYANLAAAQADLVGTVFHYELATPQLINLTQEGKVDGELAVYENGTVYNTSDTFHADIAFDVSSNRSAQITGLLESSVYQAKLIDSKASKVQEAWIEPTLVNGWVNTASGTQTSQYYKDEFGVVHIIGLIQSGTATDGTTIFNLPIGYRPSLTSFYPVVSNNNIASLSIASNGDVKTNFNVSSTWLSLQGISFKVGE